MVSLLVKRKRSVPAFNDKDGLIWVEPSKTTVEGLASLIDGLTARVSALENDRVTEQNLPMLLRLRQIARKRPRKLLTMRLKQSISLIMTSLLRQSRILLPRIILMARLIRLKKPLPQSILLMKTNSTLHLLPMQRLRM